MSDTYLESELAPLPKSGGFEHFHHLFQRHWLEMKSHIGDNLYKLRRILKGLKPVHRMSLRRTLRSSPKLLSPLLLTLFTNVSFEFAESNTVCSSLDIHKKFVTELISEIMAKLTHYWRIASFANHIFNFRLRLIQTSGSQIRPCLLPYFPDP